jgi:CheY-like chemotaxis protein
MHKPAQIPNNTLQGHAMNHARQRTKTSVLVVDDTPANLALLSDLLKDDYQVKVATGGARALEIARSDSKPDLILLDVLMPGIDGYAVCRELKRDDNTRHIPIIFLTSRSDPADEERGLQLGAADYIAKPISPPVVLARISSQLKLQAYANQLELLILEHTAELAQTRSQFEKLLELSMDLDYESDPQALLGRVLQVGMKMLNCDAGAFLVRDAENSLVLAAHTRTQDTGTIKIPLFDPQTRAANVHDICADCVHSRQTLLVDDLTQESRYSLNSIRALDALAHYSTQSLLILPVVPRSGNALGVLCFFNAKGTRNTPFVAFHHTDIRYIEAHAAHAAAVLFNRR